jgi:hypothetical protein
LLQKGITGLQLKGVKMPKPRKKMKGHTKSCAQKQAFDTEDKARAASRRGRFDFMMPYKCKKCGAYHYGHPSAKHVPKFSG